MKAVKVNISEFLILLSLILLGQSSFSQAQVCPASQNQWQWPTHTNWYFGKEKKLNFGANGSTAPILSTLTTGGIDSYEGTSSISDESGNLIFYTNGIYIWNAAGTQIPVPGGRLKAGAENASGDYSSAVQGVLVAKHPLNTNDYYIFTTDDAISGAAGLTYGFNYSIYNKAAGTVSAPTRIGNFRSTEQLAATWHANGVDIWIATHEATPAGSTTYNTYLLSCSGLNTTPVKSNLGFLVVGQTSNERSSLQFSWDGKKAGATHHCGDGTWDPQNSVCIMNFNNQTGVFSGSTGINTNDADHSNPYDCEFSPSGNRLYVTYLCDPYTPINGKIGYFNVGGGNGYTELTSNFAGSSVNAASIKLGGDGSLYVASFIEDPWNYRNTLAKISTPDGTPSLNVNAINVGTENMGYGLPNMFIPPRDYLEIQPAGPFCVGDAPVDLSVKWKCKNISAEDALNFPNAWSGPGITNTTTGLFNPTVAGPGKHLIKYQICTIEDTIYIIVKPKPNAHLANQTKCNNDPAVTFDAGPGYSSYVWSANGTGTARTTPGSTAGTYTVIVDSLGCKDTVSATLTVTTCSCPDTSLNNIPAQCSSGGTINLTTYKITAEAGTWTIQSAPVGSTATITGTTFNIKNTVAGNYVVRYTINTTQPGCATYAERTIVINAKPNVVIAPKSICQGDPAASFDAGAGFTTYAWDNGLGIAQNYSTNINGPHGVIVTDAKGCKDTALTNLTVNTKPNITVNNVTVCQGLGGGTFNAGSGYANYNWDNGLGSMVTYNTSTSGNHSVIVTTTDGCKDTASATLTINPNPSITLTNLERCAGDPSVIFDAGAGFTVYNWDNGAASTQQLSTKISGTHTVIVTDANTCKDTVSATLTENPKPSVTLADKSICPLDPPAIFDATTAGVTYNWDNNAATTAQLSTSIAGLHTVIITTAKGCKDTASATLTVLINFDATISVSATQDTVCKSAPAFTVTKLMAGGTWSATCGSCIDNTGKFTPSLATLGKNTITYSNSSSCGDTATVDVFILPVFTSSISANATVCEKEKHTFTNSFMPVDPSTLGYTIPGIWKMVGGGNGINALTGEFDAALSGVGTFKVTYNISPTIYPCYIPDTAVITVLAKPVVNISGDTTVCSSSAGIQLGGSITGGTWVGQGMNSSSGYFSTAGLGDGYYPIQYQLNAVQCKDSADYMLHILHVPATDFSGDKLMGCVPLQVNFTDASEEVPVSSIWQFNQGSGNITSVGTAGPVTYTNAGDYDVTLINTYANGCSSTLSKSQYIHAYAIPDAEFTSSPELISTLNPIASFTDLSSADVTTWDWKFTSKGTPTTSTLKNPEVTFSSVVDDTVQVWLTVTNQGGCIDSITHNVILRTNTVIYVPNAFTPNADGTNDIFFPTGINYAEKGYEFMVFDRWGELIFKTNNASEGWNGKRDNNLRDAQIDVYVWRVTYVDHFSGVKQDPIVGIVSLVR